MNSKKIKKTHLKLKIYFSINRNLIKEEGYVLKQVIFYEKNYYNFNFFKINVFI